MNTQDILSFIKQQLENNKAENIIELDVQPLTQSFDFMVIGTGTSTRHVQSIARKLIAAAKEAGMTLLGTEGEAHGEWVLVDFGDVVAHVMLKSQRELYQLEKLWMVTEQFKKNAQ
jgi:ribosome-associated protein